MRKQEMERQKRELQYKRQAMDAQIAALRAEFEIVQLKALKVVSQDEERTRVLADDRVQMAKQRRVGDVKGRKTVKRP